ncbi:V-type ATPase 116kDa subunit family protein [Rhodococcus sp. AG1013]|uniref:V-type ATPase 116kDa subunit family protein n=1 Tax=unclassified Rhodococcus (in: high G+C Gram-positive bacteria) TaxID=192944 RepID=UPI000E2D20D6|nr:V-type ATPase 116kDa subunit family protein [Rhodococcus sp. AG1013]RDI23212.1 V/A-type H+-transporting ATPase subunit I [Rhodococcus sp. AG1013]
MWWPSAAAPARMRRVALVAPVARIRPVLVQTADAGIVEIDVPEPPTASRDALRAGGDTPTAPRLSLTTPDRDALERAGRRDLLAGESELDVVGAAAVVRGGVAAFAGWARESDVLGLARQLEPEGGAVVLLLTPLGTDPPTALATGGTLRRSFAPLVDTYGTVPYADLDPTLAAGLAYVFMFGMMFGDVGHGALLVIGGLLLRAGRLPWTARYGRVWPFVAGAGAAAAVFGLLYGECFGPTGVVPVLWIAPLEQPVTLLGVALGVGAVLLAGAYVLGTVNRWREGGWAAALSAPSGLAGAAVFAGLGMVVLGLVAGSGWLLAGGVVVALGLLLASVGFLATAEGGAAGVVQTVVELFDAVIRLGANLVSFARLAAFGLTHAAVGMVVWDGTTNLWRLGGVGMVAAVAVFSVGNALAFALEALVAGVQALRLEYYELFSRIFVTEGRPFRPWHVPLEPSRRIP